MPSPPATPDAFEEAVAYFRQRVPMTDDEYEALEKGARAKAFTVARVAQLDVISQVYDALQSAIANGTTYADFRDAVGASLTAAWGEERPWHMETIFRTNVQMAYGAGRWNQMTDPAIMKARPFWKYSTVLDSRTSDICRAIAGTVLPADSAFWQSHNPPLHHNCRSGIIALTDAQAQRQGISDAAPRTAAADGFGQAPGGDFEPDLSKYAPPLVAIYGRRDNT